MDIFDDNILSIDIKPQKRIATSDIFEPSVYETDMSKMRVDYIKSITAIERLSSIDYELKKSLGEINKGKIYITTKEDNSIDSIYAGYDLLFGGGKLIIKQNNIELGTFSANQKNDVIINLNGTVNPLKITFTKPIITEYFLGESIDIIFEWNLSKPTTKQNVFINNIKQGDVPSDSRSMTVKSSESFVFKLQCLDLSGYIENSVNINFYDKMWIGSIDTIIDQSSQLKINNLRKEEGLTNALFCKNTKHTINADRVQLIAIIPNYKKITNIVVKNFSQELIDDFVILENFDTYNNIQYNLYYLPDSFEPFNDEISFTITNK